MSFDGGIDLFFHICGLDDVPVGSIPERSGESIPGWLYMWSALSAQERRSMSTLFLKFFKKIP